LADCKQLLWFYHHHRHHHHHRSAVQRLYLNTYTCEA